MEEGMAERGRGSEMGRLEIEKNCLECNFLHGYWMVKVDK